LEPRVQVLEHPRPHVVEPGATVGGRWALVEDPRLTVVAGLADLLDDVTLTPTAEDALLERDEIEGIDRSERHGRPSYGGPPWASCSTFGRTVRWWCASTCSPAPRARPSSGATARRSR